MSKRIFNFSAGPAVLPESVLQRAQAELLNYQGTGMSIMEMSHRSVAFEAVRSSAESQLRDLLGVPDAYEVLFLQGGASLQFSMVPMNLGTGQGVNLIQTGSWTQKATKDIQRVEACRVVASSEDKNFNYIPSMADVDLTAPASFVYLCSNNTIFGTRWVAFPNTGDVPLVADMSSDILSRQLDVSQFGLIFAGAQKNLGPSGVTLVIVRKDLVERASSDLPTMMQYRTHVKAKSMYNTPPTLAIYFVKLVLDWIQEQGGLSAVEAMNNEKADRLYDAIDRTSFYSCPTEVSSRSWMNVVFRIQDGNGALEAQFIKDAEAEGLSGLKGHRSVGGLRASIYNAQPQEGVDALIQFMRTFERQHEGVVAVG